MLKCDCYTKDILFCSHTKETMKSSIDTTNEKELLESLITLIGDHMYNEENEPINKIELEYLRYLIEKYDKLVISSGSTT